MKGQGSILEMDLGQLGVDQQVSDTENNWDDECCTGLSAKEEYCY